MILYNKIKQQYNAKQVRQKFDPRMARAINKNLKNINISYLVKYINFKEIGYTIKDLEEDYPNLKNEYKEFEILYKIFSLGKNINMLKKELGLTDTLDYYLKRGINFNSDSPNLDKIIDILEMKIDYKDFKIDLYPSHIELFGEKEKLIKFRKKYDIEHEVLFEPIKNKWHLAFDGLLANYIRDKLK